MCKLLSVKETAARLGMSTSSVRQLVATGRLPVVRLDRRLRFQETAIQRAIEQAERRAEPAGMASLECRA